MSLVAKNYTSEAGHWYTRDGRPAYTVIGKNGSERNTTLRDARTMSLVPSVTTILGVAAKPALEQWKMRQVLFAALTLPRTPIESEEEYLDRILSDSKEQGRAAADEGTKIHAAIQKYYENDPRYPAEFLPYVSSTDAEITKTFGHHPWTCEESFAHESGFGGKCDMYTKSKEDPTVGIILDVKTKEFTDPKDVKGYDEHMMQLAAYRVGLGIHSARCANVFVSRNVPGLIKIIEWPEEDIQRGWAMFTKLLEFWQLKNDHK